MLSGLHKLVNAKARGNDDLACGTDHPLQPHSLQSAPTRLLHASSSPDVASGLGSILGQISSTGTLGRSLVAPLLCRCWA